ncbi:hypothetical protein FNV43_RR26870 [Rhamnella rubrinervis]|uniref:Uncharacterized protein n=1 Tax=Rhamnella rubrinervis TaxID=2594499 RepID=A0A8K0GP59_9ROSA|nr:hypothetical protein FNV43_RR26870 [Rhamnella rubrinervis]
MDTLQVRMAPNPPAQEHVPEIFRKEVLDWDRDNGAAGRGVVGLTANAIVSMSQPCVREPWLEILSIKHKFFG